jgi:predicted 2-oxoglutarate/Fe(II)-dependent dioxygenase YbiX
VFSTQELDALERVAADATDAAGVGGDHPAARRSKVRWLGFDPKNAWAYQRLGEAVASINAEHYHFELTGIGEQIQLARYEADERGHYDWHQDYGVAEVSRKLSVTVQLADPNLYDGGDLQIMTNSRAATEPGRERGLVIVFPAYQLHRVTPVERGARHSLVAWVSGPPFR